MKWRSEIDINEIDEELKKAEIYEDENGNKVQTIYLGSILNLTPSGKVYTPFACSNLERCERCNGTGQIKNKNAKRKKYERETRKQTELLHNMRNMGYNYPIEWKEKTQRKLHKIYENVCKWTEYVTCPECDGIGSLEARIDQDWWEALEAKLETINAWSHGSEGDGCDVMISRLVE